MIDQPHQGYTNPVSIEFSAEERNLAIIQLSARIDEMTPLLTRAGEKGDSARVVELAQHIENVRKICDKFYVKAELPGRPKREERGHWRD